MKTPYQNPNFNVPNPEIGVSIRHTKQLTYPTIQEQQQYWINKEAQSNNATNETRDALIAALEDVELRATQDRIASGIGKRKNKTEFLLGALERIKNVARAAIDASNLSKSDSTTADPKLETDLSRTEATAQWFDGLADTYWSLRDEGRNPDGSGMSYGERNG